MARVTPRHPVDALRAQWNRVRVARADILRTRETAERLSAELSACRSEIAALTARVEELQQFTNGAHQATLAGLRFARDDDVRSRATLWELRETPEYARAFEEDEPLITVLVTTYRNWPRASRVLPSWARGRQPSIPAAGSWTMARRPTRSAGSCRATPGS